VTNPLVTVIVAWFVLGFIWAGFYDTINTDIPSSFPGGLSESPGTWGVLLWIWNAGVLMLALSIAFAAFKPASNQGPSMNPAILSAVEIFVCWTILIILWAALYTPINHTIPDAFKSFGGDPPGYLLSYYNSGTMLLMVGLGIAVIGRNT